MIKRAVALILCLMLITAVFPTAHAATEAEKAEICTQIRRDYSRTRYATGKSNLSGYCGLMVGWQLYYRGVNQWPVPLNGNRQFDYYKTMERTTGGHRVKAYAAQDYSFAEAMYAATDNGQRDVYNMLVGFQWTNTEAGTSYGHAVVVYAIIDGMVYFTEGFSTTLGGYAGNPIVISIDRFIAYYDDWTRFEGLIVFGDKDYLKNCRHYPCNMFAETVQKAPIYSLPCAPETDEADAALLRTVAAGERLLVTGLYKNTLGQFYYQVQDDGKTGYVAAQQLQPLRFNSEDITQQEIRVPVSLRTNTDFDVGGTVASQYSTLQGVRVEVTDQNGKPVINHLAEAADGSISLDSAFNASLDLRIGEKGSYTYAMYADIRHYYVENGAVQTEDQRICIVNKSFRVGNVLLQVKQAGNAKVQQPRNGWVYEQDTWYYYENNVPRTGWFCYKGVDYYLQPDGAVTTGWAELNGRNRYFSETGAMRTGWLECPEGQYYLMSNGAAATGWFTGDGKKCYFNSNGIFQNSGWITDNGERYYLLEDGSVATGWLELDGVRFYFRNDGRLLVNAKLAKNNE